MTKSLKSKYSTLLVARKNGEYWESCIDWIFISRRLFGVRSFASSSSSNRKNSFITFREKWACRAIPLSSTNSSECNHNLAINNSARPSEFNESAAITHDLNFSRVLARSHSPAFIDGLVSRENGNHKSTTTSAIRFYRFISRSLRGKNKSNTFNIHSCTLVNPAIAAALLFRVSQSQFIKVQEILFSSLYQTRAREQSIS
jgi:hypothetical protein